MIKKYKNNPVITPEDILVENDELEVFGVFNPGATKYHNKILLLTRVAIKPKPEKGWIKVLISDKQNDYNLKILRWKKKKSLKISENDARYIDINNKRYLTSLSVFYLAQSSDGFNFSLSSKPVLTPANDYEIYGIEDPRISFINDIYYITYTAVSENSFCVALTSTKDFEKFERHGIIFPPENKDVVLFPDKIGDKYYALHRPTVSFLGKPSIWIAQSYDLIHWGNHKLVFTPLNNKWERIKIGAGPEPILTDKGWLLLYHSCGDNEIYSMSVALLKKENPSELIGRMRKPVIVPQHCYESQGIVTDVIFSNGWIKTNENKLLIYYGAADKYIAVAETDLDELLNSFK
jgi:predicted GH43/DUF377 family glycosyl hydrolase